MAISAFSFPDSMRPVIASKLEPRPERRIPSLRLAGWILMCWILSLLFVQACFPQIELPICGLGVRNHLLEGQRVLTGVARSGESAAFTIHGPHQAWEAKPTPRIRFHV